MSLRDKKVIVGLTGGIACYKVPYLVRYLVKAGATVQVVMTEAATKFITPLTMETVSRNPVCTDMFPERGFVSVRHIEMAQWADLFVIAPATANFLGKINSGVSDDLLTTMVCATKKPVLIAPSMNPGMWSNKITQRNVASLKELGYKFIGPAEGEMAEPAFGVGRMVEPDELFGAVKEFFARQSKKKALSGRRILVTAGPCREPLDPVRYISNRSSGKMGYAIAEAALESGAQVTLISGPTQIASPPGVKFVAIETTADLHKAVVSHFGKCDALFMAAAPSDFRPSKVAEKKVKRSEGLKLALTPTVDILRTLVPRRKKGQVVVGFALETDDVLANARKKLVEKRLDLIVLNDAREKGAGFEYDTNRVTLLQPGRKSDAWPLMSKKDVAEKLVERVAMMLAKGGKASGKAR